MVALVIIALSEKCKNEIARWNFSKPVVLCWCCCFFHRCIAVLAQITTYSVDHNYTTDTTQCMHASAVDDRHDNTRILYVQNVKRSSLI